MNFIKLFFLTFIITTRAEKLTTEQTKAYRNINIYIAASKLKMQKHLESAHNKFDKIKLKKETIFNSKQLLEICLERFNTLKRNESNYGQKFNQEVKNFVKEYFN